MTAGNVPLDFVPSTPEDLARCLADPQWRIGSGYLYKIMVKTDVGDGTIIPFKANRAQRRFISRLWHRNIILKARQLGFTTLIAILWLDHALFNENQRCGIIAQDREAAEIIFRDKVKLAYNHLPEQIRAEFPLERDSASELLFAHNNSSVRVATSMRSGTIHRLHISEYGKICAKYKDKATEVSTGSIPAVPLDGIVVIESTAEGQDGDFFDKTQKAMALAESCRELTERDYRFHFFPWWQEPGYRINGANVVLTDKDREYFERIEGEMDCELDGEQRAWYVATRDADFSGDPEKMWQEYPSTPKEAFQVSTEGCYYTEQIAQARKQGRIGFYPHVDGYPVNTFWDIGAGDGTAIWLHQHIKGENRFFGFIEAWGEPYSYFTTELARHKYQWGTHYLPHDAGHKRQQGNQVVAPIDELQASNIAGVWDIVPRVGDVVHGIQATRAKFGQCTFDEAGCKAGLVHLGRYRKEWDARLGCWKQTPVHDVHSEASDALRQFGQGYTAPRSYAPTKRKTISWRVA